jgi:acetoin utilization protein AcuB
LNKKAHQIMSREPVAVDKETSIEAAVNLLLSENVSCLPVTSPEGDVEGILTWKDIFKAYLSNKV